MAPRTKPEPRRVRLTVPAVDESVTAWLDLQDDASMSMRTLIRESILRDGYIDVVNRPIDQQPRRGRPPKENDANEGAVSAGDEVDEVDQTELDHQPQPQPAAVPMAGAADRPAPEPEPIPAPEIHQLEPESASEPEPQGTELESVQPAPTPASTQMDMEALFGAVKLTRP